MIQTPSRFSLILKACLTVVFALTVSGCGPEQAGSDDAAAQSQVGSTAKAQALVAKYRNGGSITVNQMLVDTDTGPLLSVGAVVTSGPSQVQRTCKTRVLGSCELLTCPVPPGADKGIDVGPLVLSTASANLTVPTQFNDTYGFVYNFFDAKTLWTIPGDLVTTTYTIPGAAATTVTQAAPAGGIFMKTVFPPVITKTAPVVLRWIGQKQGDGGKVYAYLLSEQAQLTCSATPDQGRVIFPAGALGQLPAGAYMGFIQAENRLVDANGVTHSLSAPVDAPNIMDVTVQ